jgi:hypothetical protein
MLELRLVLTPRSAKLTWTKGEAIVEEEVWTFSSPTPKSELRDIAECVFHDCYDLLNYSCHGTSQ